MRSSSSARKCPSLAPRASPPSVSFASLRAFCLSEGSLSAAMPIPHPFYDASRFRITRFITLHGMSPACLLRALERGLQIGHDIGYTLLADGQSPVGHVGRLPHGRT